MNPRLASGTGKESRRAAQRVSASRYSSAADRHPAAEHALDRLAAGRRAVVEARRRARPPPARASGRSQTAVTIPSVPSEPIEQALEVVAGDVLADRAADRDRARRARRPPRRPVTQSPVTPYLNACGPPALVATLPPICDCSAAPGSGGKSRPFSRASRRTSPVAHAGLDLHPPEQRVERADARHAARAPSTTPPSNGTAPPAKPVPPPRGTIGTSCS